MDHVALTSDLSLSRIVYGMWRLADDADTSPAHVQAKIEACLEQGITTFDQADIYGGYTAEAIFGGALKAAPHLREKMQIVTKCGIVAPEGRHANARVKHYDTSRAHIEAAVEHSLHDMGIEQVDLLLIHRPDPFMDPEETGRALDTLVSSGKVAHVGVSNFKAHDWTLLDAAMRRPLVTNQIEISLLHSAPFRNGDIAFLQERHIPPMAWSPLAGGRLFAADNTRLQAKLQAIAEDHGVEPTAVAVAWLLAHPARIVPVMGTNTLERIARLGVACDLTIDRETWFDLYTTALGAEVP
jgi:predicted oxidoreductase